MARTLRRIASEGADVFYRGEIAEQIASDMERNGGLLSLEDLRNYRTRRCDPLRGSYRGYGIATNNPPGGGIMLLEMLNNLENFDLFEMGHNSADYKIGRASWRERVCQYVYISVVSGSIKKKRKNK